jgi:hypothetical protein
MNILYWKIRCLNAKRKQVFLKERIKKEQQDILLLQEMKCAGLEETTLQRCWTQAQNVDVDARGVAGGILMLWYPTIILLDNFFTSKWTITTSFHLISSNKQGYITNVYGLLTDYIHGLVPCCTIQQLVNRIQIDRYEGSSDTFEVFVLYKLWKEEVNLAIKFYQNPKKCHNTTQTPHDNDNNTCHE